MLESDAGVIRSYGLNICRWCFRERAPTNWASRNMAKSFKKKEKKKKKSNFFQSPI
jgi:hypothetical protein